jgi:hypothetical protein
MIVVMIGILINNARMGDLRSDLISRIADLTARISDTRDVLRAEMGKDHSELLLKFNELDHRIDGLDNRLKRIERDLDMNKDA